MALEKHKVWRRIRVVGVMIKEEFDTLMALDENSDVGY
jgi:hypothetical protein